MKNKFLLVTIMLVFGILAFGMMSVSAETEDLSYRLSNDEIAVIYCAKTATSVEIPEMVEGYPVTEIYAEAFKGCDDLKSISIPESVKYIGSDAFYDCESLERVDITDIDKWQQIEFKSFKSNPLYYAGNLYLDGNFVTEVIFSDDVTNIGDYAFGYCNSLASINIPESVTSIGYGVFSGCTGLAKIVIPDNVISIGDYAFAGCDSLSEIQIPFAVKSIGAHAFYYCSSLVNVNIRGNVESIGDCAFEYCSSLAGISIPDSVTSIGDSVFYYCDNLISVTIGNGIELIDMSAFMNCSSLKYVCIPESIKYIRNDAFNNCPNIETVFYAGSESQWGEILFYIGNKNLTNAKIIYNAGKKSVEYKINSITVSDNSDNVYDVIPSGTFLASISFTNISSGRDKTIVLAKYLTDGTFDGLIYESVEDVPIGFTIKLTLPVENENGDVASLKAFCLESLTSLIPLGEAVTLPQK